MGNVVYDNLPKTMLMLVVGDDDPEKKALAEDVTIISVSTPSYAASHEVGYRVALKGLVQIKAKKLKPNGRINILVGAIISLAEHQ